MTTQAVTFNYEVWVASFPEFAAVSEPLATSYFNRACLILANETCNPAFGSGLLPALFNLLTAHIAWLNAPRDANGNPASTGQPAPPVVGRINSASEGSVSVGAEWSGPAEAAYFLQSKYGAEYWAATAQYRTFRYAAQPTFVPTAIFPSRGR